MKTLYRAVGRSDIGGEPLPTVFRTFANNQIVFRRAELSMIAGTPGAGKSTLALALALRMARPTLYFSADTNAHTMAMRLYSMLEGVDQNEVEKIMTEDPLKVKRRLWDARHIDWSFDSAPNLDDIDEHCRAFEEVHGANPEVIIIDNLMDVSGSNGGDVEQFAGMRQVMHELKYLARDTNAAVVVLHHTKESYVGTPCQPRSAVQGMVNQLPALILTVGQENNGLFGVAAVKNRYGKADPSGGSPVWLQFAPASMYIADLPEQR